MSSSLDEYLALVSKVDDFASTVQRRRAGDMQCRAGCSGCCHTELSVSPVEAERLRRHLGTRSEALRLRLAERARGDRGGRCVMLDPDGTCAVYAARPLVCRTQGLPLRYPPGMVPVEAVVGRAQGGELTWCPLNFDRSPPEAQDVLDAERVDTLLAVVNQRFAEARGGDALERLPLVELCR